jgi:hypothetical protein
MVDVCAIVGFGVVERVAVLVVNCGVGCRDMEDLEWLMHGPVVLSGQAVANHRRAEDFWVALMESHFEKAQPGLKLDANRPVRVWHRGWGLTGLYFGLWVSTIDFTAPAQQTPKSKWQHRRHVTSKTQEHQHVKIRLHVYLATRSLRFN